MKRKLTAIAISVLCSLVVAALPVFAAAAPAPPGPASWVTNHPLGRADLVFPFPAGARYDKKYTDNYGDSRSWSPSGEAQRSHEGIDIFAPKGTPLVAIGSGKVVRIGWNRYGGWRLTIALDGAQGYSVYYAHLNGYGYNLYEGARVKKGQIIGYVGRTGYGPQGTEGDFLPHLHLGIYAAGYGPINPYAFLKHWEKKPPVRLK